MPAAEGTLSLSGTTWTFTPASGFSGTATITYTIADQDGATDTATHTVVVANAAPVLVDPDPHARHAVDPSIPTHLIVPATDNVAVSIDLDSYFTDPNGDTLSFSVGALPAWLAYNATTHVISGTPPADNAGSVDVAVTVTDGNGGIPRRDGDVRSGQPRPRRGRRLHRDRVRHPVVVDLLANDTDADGDPLTVTSATVPAAQGTLALSGTTWTFTPASGFSGTATITYTIADQDGATDTATHTVVVGERRP